MLCIRQWRSLTGKFVNRVMPQVVAIVGIFVAANDLIHPLADQLRQAMRDFVRVTPLLNAVRDYLTHLHVLLGL
jgi:hypothetical protein